MVTVPVSAPSPGAFLYPYMGNCPYPPYRTNPSLWSSVNVSSIYILLKISCLHNTCPVETHEILFFKRIK